MRFYYTDLSRPKKAAKSIARLVDGIALSEIQNGLAVALGYGSWHELEKGHSAVSPSLLDQYLEPETLVPGRLSDIALRLADALDLYWGDAAFVLAKSHATGDLPLDEWMSISLRDAYSGIPIKSRDDDRLGIYSHSELVEAAAARVMRQARERKPVARVSEPNRLRGEIPFPPSAASWLEKIITDLESQEDVEVMHAHYLDREDHITCILRFPHIENGIWLETESDYLHVDKDEIDWLPNTFISQRARLPGYREGNFLKRFANLR